MRPYLGPRLWAEFVAHASRRYKAAWLRAFTPASGVLRCVGTIDGSPCPHGVEADLLADERSVGRGARARTAARGPRAILGLGFRACA